MNELIEQKGRECIDQVLNGNQEAFREFIKLYERLVFSIASKLISRREDRDDICQDVFIKVFQNLKSFRAECSISTWIGKISYHTCINYLRKKKELIMDTDDSLSVFKTFTCPELSPEHILENQDLSLRLSNEIRQLPEHYRTALNLFHMQGLKYNEISEIMSLPEGTVKSHLFRARQLLKKRLLVKYQKQEWVT